MCLFSSIFWSFIWWPIAVILTVGFSIPVANILARSTALQWYNFSLCCDRISFFFFQFTNGLFTSWPRCFLSSSFANNAHAMQNPPCVFGLNTSHWNSGQPLDLRWPFLSLMLLHRKNVLFMWFEVFFKKMIFLTITHIPNCCKTFPLYFLCHCMK